MKEYLSNLNHKYVGIAAILFLAFAIGGVSQITENTARGDYGKDQVEDDITGAQSLDLSMSSADSAGVERKKATRMYLDLEVPDVEEAQRETQQMAEEHGGYVTSSRLSREPATSGSLDVKIPENSTTNFLSDVEGAWKVESRNVNTEDVTDRYTELELELKNKRQELQRLEELMNRTDEVDSLIKVQERMSELRSRIQYLENQLEQLDRRVEYTTITLNYDEPQPFHTEFELVDSFKDAYKAVFDSMNLLIVGIGYLLPFLVIGGIIYKGRNLWREFNRAE